MGHVSIYRLMDQNTFIGHVPCCHPGIIHDEHCASYGIEALVYLKSGGCLWHEHTQKCMIRWHRKSDDQVCILQAHGGNVSAIYKSAK